MPTRRRVRTYTPDITVVVSGEGGGGGLGNVQWGPDFGEGAGADGNTFTAGARVNLDAIAVENNKSVGVTKTMDAVALENSKSVGTTKTMDALALENSKSVGVNKTMDSLVLENAKSVFIAKSFDALAVENISTPGIHLSGTVIGAPFWQSEAHATNEAATEVNTVTVTKPSGTVEGDLLLAFCGVKYAAVAPAFNVPSGWTAVSGPAGANSLRIRTFYKIAGASEPANYTFTLSAGALHFLAEIHRINAADTTTPIDVNQIATLAASSLDPDPDNPSVTTTVANTRVFAYCLHDHLALSQTHTNAANHVERTDYQSTFTGSFVGAHTIDRVFSATGATGTVEHNCTETAATAAYMQRVAIRPGELVIAT